jgi:hypothetical protein
MKKKSIAIGIALVIVAVVVALMSFTNKPVEKTVAVNVYKGGEVVETSTIRIAGNIKNSFLTSECSFVGTFAIEYCENLCRDGVEAKIEWGDGYQSILFFYAGDFTNFNVSKIEIDRQMDSIIVYLADGTIIATPDRE